MKKKNLRPLLKARRKYYLELYFFSYISVRTRVKGFLGIILTDGREGGYSGFQTSEAVARSCSVENVFLKISQNSR